MRIFSNGIILILLLAVLIGCGPQPTLTPQPTYTPLPTYTPQPTFTPLPTLTPLPDVTPNPEEESEEEEGITASLIAVTNLREGPGLSFEPIIELAKGETLRILGRNRFGDWLYVRTETETEGWVSRRQVNLLVREEDIPLAEDIPETDDEAEDALETDSGEDQPTPTTLPEEQDLTGVNLLVNPGFEEPYYRIVTEEGGGAIAEGWTAWWFNDDGPDYSVPEYEIAPMNRDPFRVHSGEAAQQVFRPTTLWEAGVYQQVSVPAGSELRFSVWGHSWSSFCVRRDNPNGADTTLCNPRNSNDSDTGNPFYQKIGVDPTGGTNGRSSTIVWSEEKIAWDTYQQFSVEATAQGTTVTVFLWSTPYFPATVNNAYWDDAELTILPEE